MKPHYLLYGFGSEYVLHPLYEELKKLGFPCTEIDALSNPDSKKIVNALVGQPVIFITSAHFNLNEKNFRYFYSSENHFYGVLEILSLLKPVKSIFVPHDLTQPLIDYEKEYLNQFDLFCSPCEPFTSLYAHYCPTLELGWIKYKKGNKPITTVNNAIWFLSDFTLHLKMGVEKSYTCLEPILKQHVSIKFPTWPGTDEFEAYFSRNGINVVSNQENSIDLILAHDMILSNGLSSIIAESSFLGKTTVNIVEGSHYGKEQIYLQNLFPLLVFIEKIDDFDKKAIPIKQHPAVLKPFDMKSMIQFLSNL